LEAITLTISFGYCSLERKLVSVRFYEGVVCFIALWVNGFGFNTQVDKGFVAQVADVSNGRSAPMNEDQKREAEKTVVGEFSDVKHVRGILSMGRLGLSRQ